MGPSKLAAKASSRSVLLEVWKWGVCPAFWASFGDHGTKPQGCCVHACSLSRLPLEYLVPAGNRGIGEPAPFIRKGVRAAPTGVAQRSPPSPSPSTHPLPTIVVPARVQPQWPGQQGPRTSLLLAQLPDRFYCTLEKKLFLLAGPTPQGLANSTTTLTN